MTDVDLLLSVMDNLRQAHQQLLEACRRQEQSLIRNDTDATEQAVAEVERCVSRVTELEQQRQVVAARVAESFQIPADELTVSVLLARLDDGQNRRLAALTGDLQDLLYEIRKINQVNDGLAQNALSYVRQMLHIVASTLEEDRYGHHKTGVGGRLFSAEA